MKPLLPAVTVSTLTALVLLPATPISAQLEEVDDALDAVQEALAQAAGVCNDLDPADCLLPFPSDVLTTPDDSTPTGLRVDVDILAMPTNIASIPVDPTELNRNDGWSPGSPLFTFVPGIDLEQTFDISGPQMDQPSTSLKADAPIVIIDTVTGERVPYLAELDEHPETANGDRLLIIRPLRNFEEGHRHVVGLRNLKTAAGATIAPQAAFAGQLASYSPGSDDVIDPLAAAGVEPGQLFLAWDFTIISEQNMAGRVLAMRDHAFSLLGDTDLTDLEIQGSSPSFTVDAVEDIADVENDTLRIVEGTIEVPNYLTLPQEAALPELTLPPEIEDALGDVGDLLPVDELPSQDVPGQRLNYESLTPGPMDTPVQNPLAPTRNVEYVCSIPRTATAANPSMPSLYGHGLLGSRSESRGSSTERMREDNFTMCAVNWLGMSEADIANVLLILTGEVSFASLADRTLQGFVDFLHLGRALAHPEGLRTDPAFQDGAGTPLFDGELVYDGNSQGAIMGGALAALAPDFTKATIGVVGMNYSTLLHRSVDWEGTLADEVPVGYATFLYTAYPDKHEQLLLMSLNQQLWDRGEANGYAHHVTDDPLDNTPPHQILQHVALGDYQVANLSAEVQARTAGARFLQTALYPGRHWADEHDERLFAHTPFDVAADGTLEPVVGGSAIVYWDSGNPTPPSANLPPEDHEADPHSDPRKDPFGQVQKGTFYRTGAIVDVHDLSPYCTHEFSRDESIDFDCTYKASLLDVDDVDDDAGPVPLPATGGGLAALAAALALLGLTAAVRVRRRV